MKTIYKYLVLILLQCLFVTLLHAQTRPAKQWDKRFGGNLDDRLFCVLQTKDSGYILGGTSLSGIGGDKSQAGRGGEDYWIVKINSNGTKQWDKRFGGTDNDDLSRIQQTTDGGFILAGTSRSGISGR